MRINLKNCGKIREALASVNGAATAHTFTSASDIAPGLAMAESELKSLGLRKSQWAGARMTIHSQGPTASAYKYGAIGTAVELERGASGWFMVDATRIGLRPAAANRSPRVWVWLQDCQRHAAIEALKDRIECCYRVGASQ
jgi:hypothetical protein